MMVIRALIFIFIFTSLNYASAPADDMSLLSFCPYRVIYAKDLPEELQHHLVPLKPLPTLNIDRVRGSLPFDFPVSRLASWEPGTLYERGFMTVMAVDFLHHNAGGLNSFLPGFYFPPGETTLSTEPDPRFYLSNFWDTLICSCSLVNRHKFPVAGTYGLALRIPPECLIATYQLDATSIMHHDLIGEPDPSEALPRKLTNPRYVYNSRMEGVSPTGEIITKRIYTEGEADDSHPLMTPEEMIVRGRPTEHNEIKFVPRVVRESELFEVGIMGFWYKDSTASSHGQAQFIASEDDVAQIHAYAQLLKIPVIPLSKGILGK